MTLKKINYNSTRRDVLIGAGIAASALGGLAAARAGAAPAPVGRSEDKTAIPSEPSCWLTNVRLEDGFEKDSSGSVIGTKARSANLLIKNGKIAKVATDLPTDTLPKHDMGGLLALPSFSDMHIHLDKGYYGGPWHAAAPFVSMAERIREEQDFLKAFLPETAARARALLDLITGNGVTFARIHCNVDPVSELQNKEKVVEALASFKDRIGYQLVAFPQHGLLQGNTVKLMDKALQNGYDLVGGLDPAGVDHDIERSLSTTMELAVKHNAPIDIHLHDRGRLGLFTIERLAALTEQAKWQGKVTVSHAYCLGDASPEQFADLGAHMASAGITIISSAPINVPMPPIGELTRMGIPVHFGTDNVNDHWTSYTSGILVERASRAGEIFGWESDYGISRLLKYITQGKETLKDDGTVAWPKSGEVADIAFVDASCSAEFIARRKPTKAVIRNGKPSAWAI
ncbi:MAG: Putative mtallo-dependent hydrolase domain-containing deaminase [Candidatus Tokpelaia hoelldobleri]|uniref:Mtallo-dependent hydrolase domain-containing deaminase n=1 Tax=Candidatus Tokpelaia hoelldobleri TaxID=1902579 RepID=A0A1U9JV61_9HYPH|nr:MAG: Putative mtallo-dependent hydrolase domain-containing deaminase [Candidatus Tokpelaia hoelldoblerii]